MTNQALHFGTDGVRGRADTELTVPVVRALGQAAAQHINANNKVLLGVQRFARPNQVGLVSMGTRIA